MPVTSVTRDTNALTLTVVADFPAEVQRLWEAYVDPRQLERFWGPPTWPATFTRHDAAAGGRSAYTMKGPDGDTHGGYWEWLSVEPLKSFEVRDGFAMPDGEPNPELPSMRMQFVFEKTDHGSRVTTTTWFNSLADLEQLLEMGMEEGLREAMGQMDAVLVDLTSFAAGQATITQILSDTQARISRVIRGTVEQVWRAHHDPAAAALAAGPRGLDDAGLRGGNHGRREVPLRVGTGQRHRRPLRLRGRTARVGAAVPRSDHRADDRHAGQGHR